MPSRDPRLVVSHLTVGRWSGGIFKVFSPAKGVEVSVHDPEVLRVLSQFAAPTAPNAISTSMARDELARALRVLRSAQVLVAPTAGAPPARQLWDHHDLSFHMTARLGPRPTRPPLPELEETGELPRKKTALVTLADAIPERASHAHFATLLRQRRSTRHFQDKPLPLDDLGRLLCLAARSDGGHRPYPSPGGKYPLEIYVVHPRHNLTSLRPGVHHYRPREHALERVGGYGRDARDLFERARRNGPFEQAGRFVLLCVSARFARTAPKYGSNAYSHILKEVGCLIESLYLSAAALGLGVCALGGGPAFSLNRVTGAHPLEEPAVGELLVGLPRSGDRGAPT